jgi:hypothetical protein
MTVTNTSTLSIFSDPLAVPVAPVDTNASAVDATAGLALGGESKTYSTTNFAPAPQDVVLTGTGNRLNLGGGEANVAVLGGGQIVEAAQFLGTDDGKLISIDLGGTASSAAAASDVTATVDTSSTVSGNSVGETVSIADASGGMTGTPSTINFYVHGGTGDDTIIGSFLNDFLRGGAGDDTIAAYAGNDIVRGGSGSDFIQLGDGADSLFYTSDQVVTGDTDTLQDFDTGVDALVFDSAIDSTLVFSGGDDTSGYTSVTFTSNGQSTTLTVQNGKLFQSDITFLA